MPYYDFDSEEERRRREQEAIRDAYFQEWKRQNNSAKAPKVKAAKRKEMAAANIHPVMYGGNVNPNNDQLPAMTTAEMAARQQAKYMQQVAPAADAAAAMIQNAPVDQYMMKRFLPNISDKSLEQTFAEAAKIDPNAKPAEPVKPAIINPYTSALDQAALIRDQLIPKKEELKTPKQSALQGVNVPDGGIQQPNYASKNPVIPQPSAQETYTPDEELQIADINVKTLPKKEQESLKSVAKKQQEAYQIPLFDASNIDNLDNYTVMLEKAQKEQEMVKERDEFQKRNNLTDQQMNNFLYYQQMLNDKEKNDNVRTDIRNSLHEGSGVRQTGNALALNALSIMNSPYRGVQAIAGNVAQRVLGNRPDGFGIQTSGAPYDYQNFSQAVQEETGNRIAETGAGEVGRFLYNTGVSAAESAYNMALTGMAGSAIGGAVEGAEALKTAQQILQNASLLPFGANAYASTYQEARQRGLDDRSAALTATVSGAAEIITEKVSLDSLWDMARGNKRFARNAIVNALAQAGIEGSEEVASDLINAVADRIINGDRSEYEQDVQSIMMQNGGDEEDARRQATRNFIKDVGMSFLGGAISGGVMGTAATAVGTATNQAQANQMFDQNTNYAELANSIDTNRDSYENKSAYQSALKAQEKAVELDQKQKSGETITNKDKRNLYTNMMDAVQVEAETEENTTKQEETTTKQEETTPNTQLSEEDTTSDTTIPTTEQVAPTTEQEAPTTKPEAKVTENEQNNVTNEQNNPENEQRVTENEQNDVTSDVPEQYRATYVNDTELAEQLQNAKSPQELVEAYQNAVDTRQGNEHELTMAKGYYDAYALKMAKAKTNNYTLEDIAKAAETTLSTQRAYEAGLNEQQIDKSVLSSAAQQAYNDGLQSALVARERNESVQQNRMKQLANGYMTDISRRAFIERYIPGMNADIYKKSFDMAYDAGRQVDTYTIPGADAKQAIEKSWDDFAKKNSIIFAQLSVDQAKGIFSEGMTTAMRDRQAAIARSNMEKLTAVKGNGTFTDLRANPTNDASTRVIAGAARLFGLNIELRDSIEGGSNGYYDAKRGTIVLNASSGKTLVTLAHELGEFTDAFNTEEFQPLVQSGMQTLNEILGEKEYQNMRRAYEDVYVSEFLNEKRKKTDADLDKEIFCDNIFTILGSEEGMNNLIRKIDQNCTVPQAKTIKEKLSEMIDKVIDAFKSIISSGKLNKWQQAVAEDSAKRMQDLQDRLTSAMANAVKNYETASLQEIESDIPVQKRFNLEAGVEQTKDLIAVHNLTSDQLLGDIALGGLPSPSIAIIRTGMGHSMYGDVSLVFNKDTIDPKKNKKNKVYSQDAWTPTFPTVEYKVNEKKLRSIENKIKDAVPYEIEHALSYLSLDEENASNKINSADGDPVEAYANNDTLKYAYLKDKGIEVKAGTREKRLSTKFSNQAISQISEILPDDERMLNNTSSFMKENPELVEQARTILNNEFKDKLKNRGATKLKLLEKELYPELYFSDFDNIVRAVDRFREEGITQEPDPSTIREAVNSQADEEGFRKWLSNLFDGVVEKKGLRNKKSAFTNNGNRRSWDQLHDDYTLENIVKIMNQEDDKGANAFFAQSAIQGISAKDFRSIDEIRKAKGQLQKLTEEEYKALKDQHAERFHNIASALLTGKNDYFSDFDHAAQSIAEAMRNYQTASGIEQDLKKWHGSKAYDGIGRDIVDLRDSIAEMPTGYFEAKPKRAVWLDEVQYAIIPDNSPAELTKALSDNNITYRTYAAGNEASRLEVMDSLEDVRFSREVNSEGKQLTEDQQEYFKDSKVRTPDGSLKVMYHGTPTGGFTVFKNGLQFFTDSREYADRYQNPSASSRQSGKKATNPQTYAVYLNITKPFDIRDPKMRKTFINDYVKGGWALGINPYTEYKDSTVSGLPSWEEADNIYDWMEENDLLDQYDGILVDEGGIPGENGEVISRGIAYITFSPKQIKNIDNLSPTSDQDIRYSRDVESEAPEDIVSSDSRKSLEILSSDKDDVVTIPSLKGDPTIFFTGTDEEIAAYEAQENAAKDQWKAIIDASDFAAFQVDLSRGRTKILSPSIRGGLYQLSNLWNGEPVSHQLFGKEEGSEGENYWHPMKDLYSELVDLNRHHDVEVKVLKRKTADSLKDLRRSMDAPEVDFTEMIASKNDDEADSGIGNVLAEGSRILKGQQVDQQMVRKIARKLTRKYGSKADINQFADDISRVFAYAQSHDIASADSEELARIMTEVAMPVIKEAQGESNEELKKQIRKNVSGLKLDLSEQQHKEVVYKYHSYQNYKQAMRKHGIEISANGASMDGSWGEIVDKMMGTLTYAENEGNEPIMLLDALNSLDQKIVQNGFGMNNPEAAKDLAMDVIAAYYEEMGKQQTSRKGVKDKDLADLKKQVAEARKIADDYKQQIKKEYQERYDEALKDLKQARQLASEETMLQVAALRAQNRHDIQRRLDAQEKAKQKSEIQKGSRQLLNMLANPTNAKHVPISLEAPVLDLLSSIDFVGPKIDKLSDGRYQTKVIVTTEEQGQLRRRFETYVGDTYQDVMRQYQEAMQSGAGSKAQRTWQQKLSTVKDLYSRAGTEGDSNSATDLLEMLDKSLLPDLQKILDDNDGLKTISSLSADELKTINKAIKNITTAINKIDKFYTSPESVSKLGNDIMEHARKVMDTNVRSRARESLKDFFTLDNATPETYFHGLGKSGEKVFGMLTRANNVKARDIRIAQEYMADLLKDVSQKDIDSMTGEKAKIIYEEGSMKLDVGDVMYLYMLLKRQDAESHKYGGFEMDDKEIKGKVYRDTKPHFLDEKKLRDITDKLTPKQKEIAEKMQQFLAVNCSEWGNETAILLYGYEKFTDPNYIPMTVDKKTVRTNAQNSAEGMINSIRESGFTKNVIPNANNPLIIRNIFDVFSEHVTNMAAYHAYAAPLTDVIRWNNFKTTEEIEEGDAKFGRQHTVKEAIDDIYGKGGQSYLVQLVRDINQMEKQTKVGTARFAALMSHYKAAATLANLRVVAQQPTAWFRAGEMIDAKYLAAGLAPNKAADKMQAETSDISWIKAQGNIDGYITHSIKNTITRASSTREKINDAAGWLASKADDMTWNKLYRAVYAEQATKFDGDLNSEEFAKKVNDRFDDVIARTQVVDGTLMRSQLMRSNDRKNIAVAAFMAEPTKSYNMFLRDYIDITQGKREGKKIRPEDLKHLTRTAAVYLVTNVANAVMQSIFDAERDDDEDKSYIEKLLNAFGINADSEATFSDKALTFLEGNLADDLNMFHNIPIVKDIYDYVWQAVKKKVWNESTYSSGTSDMDIASIAELKKAFEYTFAKSENSKITLYGTVAQDVKALSQFTGIPAYNLMRECVALYNTLNDLWGGDNIRRTAAGKSELIAPVMKDINNGADITESLNQALAKGAKYDDLYSAIREKYKDNYIDAMENGETHDAELLENRLEAVFKELKEKEGKEYKPRVKAWYTDFLKENGRDPVEAVFKSLDTGSDYKKAIENAVSLGKTYDSIESSVTKQYKQQYIDLMRQGKRSEATKLENRLVTIYNYLNDKEGQKHTNNARIQKWYTDWQKENGVEQIELTGGSESSGSRTMPGLGSGNIGKIYTSNNENTDGGYYDVPIPFEHLREATSELQMTPEEYIEFHRSAAEMIQNEMPELYDDYITPDGVRHNRNATWHYSQVEPIQQRRTRKKTYGTGGGNADRWGRAWRTSNEWWDFLQGYNPDLFDSMQ